MKIFDLTNGALFELFGTSVFIRITSININEMALSIFHLVGYKPADK